MCTVTYIPTQTGAILSSNRDEQPLRPKAILPVVTHVSTGRVMYPLDGFALGTWIGVHELGHVIILLNGAAKGHQKRSAYAKSRGLIVKELLNSPDPIGDWTTISLQLIEPFTLVLWQNGALLEMTWDGYRKNTLTKNASVPHIWSSSTLYDESATIKRRSWFEDWLSDVRLPTSGDLYRMLTSHTESNDGFVMNRNELVKTLNISLVDIDEKSIRLRYFDLMTNDTVSLTLNLKTTHETISAPA